MNDLVSVLALPAMWSGGEPSQIVQTLLDALMAMLRLDLVYARLTNRPARRPSRWYGSLIAENRCSGRKRSARCSTTAWEMTRRNGLRST